MKNKNLFFPSENVTSKGYSKIVELRDLKITRAHYTGKTLPVIVVLNEKYLSDPTQYASIYKRLNDKCSKFIYFYTLQELKEKKKKVSKHAKSEPKRRKKAQNA